MFQVDQELAFQKSLVGIVSFQNIFIYRHRQSATNVWALVIYRDKHIQESIFFLSRGVSGRALTVDHCHLAFYSSFDQPMCVCIHLRRLALMKGLITELG